MSPTSANLIEEDDPGHALSHASGHFSPKPCRNCGAKELQRTPRTFVQRIVGLYPYTCAHCASRETNFRLKPGTALRIILVLGIAGSVYYFFVQRPFLLLKRQDDAASAQSTAVALAQARTSAGGLSTYEQMMMRKPRTTMDNAAVLKLWKANVGANVILQMIRSSNPDFDVSAAAVIDLKQAGVDQSIILAMIDAANPK